MKDLMERLVTLPFAAGCVSQSSISVVRNQPKKFNTVPVPPPPPPPPPPLPTNDGTGDSTFAPNISAGLQRLKKSIKSLPQLFIYREGDGEVEMEIGFPTNVQHVAHVGWGGSDGTGASMNSWDAGPSDLFSLPSLSLGHLELAMPSRGDAPVQCTSLRFS
ncbi:CRIB domain-containing protein RIC4-like [Dioscorea cayenensis subsp. rotundata]|uniref:CRIB domain-containing protein RIC4-like n=1 Tax=Dioscorea cayennensis subsp. rotundata TaxID=55577 RepID=A0AB40C4I4_DIOCR|nr:CRIB domain-containing protein RIC4-like [Dioscorea cayenensis subsp. rotundata]